MTEDRIKHINNLYAMLKFLREHDGECIGDHPDWIAKMDDLLLEREPRTGAGSLD